MWERRDALLYAIIIAGFIARLFLFLSPTYYAEENISIAEALSMRADGLVPYIDFIHSHPPFNLYLLSIFSEITGLDNPILSAKILSFLLSGAIVALTYSLGGLPSAALLSGAFPFFSWYSLSLPLLPLTLFLLAFKFSERFGPTPAGRALRILFSIGAFLSEFSAAPAIFALIAFGKGNWREKAREAKDAFLAFVLLMFLGTIATEGLFFSQTISYQASGRFVGAFSWLIPNAKEAAFSILLASFPLILFAFLSEDRHPLFFSGVLATAFVIFLPKLSNNTLQFLVPFLAISAGSIPKKRALKLVLALVAFAFSCALLLSNWSFSSRASGLDELSNAIDSERAGIELPEIWGTPEASLLSIRTGIPISDNFFESTPGTIDTLRVSGQLRTPSPDFLVISEYYGTREIYGNLSDYSEFFQKEEPSVGIIKLYKRKA